MLRTPVSPLTGYGRDGIGLAQALMDLGHDVRLSPSFVGPPLPRDIAGLLCEPLEGPYDLAIQHIELEQAALGATDASQARRNILWTMWGWEDLPDEDWVPPLKENLKNFDEIFVYDAASAKALAPYAGERLRTLLGGYTSSHWEVGPDESNNPYLFGMVGRLTVRKGVYTAYTAFLTMLEKHPEADARLILNSIQPVLPPQAPHDPRVMLVVEHSTAEELKEFYQHLDCLVCPSYADAKNLPPIEALSCGTSVILSDITGHRGWATSEFVSWVPTTPKQIQPGYVGGEVNVDDLAEMMWDHYVNRSKHRQKALLGARTLPAMLDWHKVIQRLGIQLGMRL